MSTWDTPEIAAAYGALDSDLFVEGMPVDAHQARVVLTNANRQQAKGEQIHCMGWGASRDTSIEYDTHHRWAPTTDWTVLIPPFPITYRKGIRSMEVSVSARISGSDTIWLQVGTTAAPFSEGATSSTSNVMAIAGDGDDDIDVYRKAAMRIDPGGEDTIDLRILGFDTGVLGEETVGGVPNTSAGITGSGLFGISPNNVNADSGEVSWLTAGYAETGHVLVFYDSGVAEVARRIIVSRGSGTPLDALYFSPPFTAAEASIVAAISSGSFEIERVPHLSVISISFMGEGRTY